MRRIILAVAVFAAVAVPLAGAATYHWTQVAHGHGAVRSASLKNVNGIAISVTSQARINIKLPWRVSCVRGSTVKITQGSFVAHGLGSKVPVKIGIAPPNSCSVDLTAVAVPAGQAYTAGIWRR